MSNENKIRLIVFGFILIECALLFTPIPLTLKIILGSILLLMGIGVSLFHTWWYPRTNKRIPLFLMLHSISDEIVEKNGPNNSVHLKTFEQLVIDLKAAGYHFQTATDAIEHPTHRSVVLTFDDGLIDNYTNLFPILKRHNVAATCFVTNQGQQNKNLFLGDEHIKEMYESGLVEFGGHSTNHVFLGRISKEDATREIQENRQRLQQLLGVPPKSFAYPSGDFTQETIEILNALGYRYAFTMCKPLRPAKTDLYRINRQIIPRGKSRFSTYLLATRGKCKV